MKRVQGGGAIGREAREGYTCTNKKLFLQPPLNISLNLQHCHFDTWYNSDNGRIAFGEQSVLRYREQTSSRSKMSALKAL